jgi:hypothetical protein
MSYIEIKNLISKNITLPYSLDCVYDLQNFENKYLKDNLNKVFDISAPDLSVDIENQLSIYKTLNTTSYSLSDSLPQSKKSKVIKEIKTCIEDFEVKIKESKYFNVYSKQQFLFKNIKDYVVDSKALNAYMLLEQNETLKSNLTGFKERKKVTYSRSETSTGRLSSKSQANILTLPRKYRNIFKSSFDNGSLFYIDFVSLEPRVMRKLGGWDCAGDIYEEIMENLDLEIDRSIVKQAIISAAYGSSKKSLYAKIAKDKVDQLCNYIKDYLCTDKCLEMAQESSENGRRTNFWGKPLWNNHVTEENVILNNYVQSTAVDVALSGFSDILEQLDIENVKPLFVIHDAVLVDVEKSYIDEFVKKVKQGYNCNILGNFPLSIEDLYGTKY